MSSHAANATLDGMEAFSCFKLIQSPQHQPSITGWISDVRNAAAATDEADTTKDGHNAAAYEHAAKADAGKLRSATVKALIRKYHAMFEYSRAMEVAQMAMEDACVRIHMADEATSYEKLQRPRWLSI